VIESMTLLDAGAPSSLVD